MRRQIVYTRLFVLGVATWVSGIVWIGSEIYHRYVTDQTTPQYQAEIAPLNPQLNIEVLNKLNDKRSLPVIFPPLSELPTPTPTPLPTIEPTPTPETGIIQESNSDVPADN